MPVSRPGAIEYCDEVFASFAAAMAAAKDAQHRQFRIGGQAVAVQATAAGVADKLTGAFGHLSRQQAWSSPDLRIHLWDQASSGQQMPMPPWLRNTHPDEQWRYDDGRLRLLIHREFAYSRTYMLLLDRQHQRALYWISDVEHAPYWEVTNPLRLLFSWWAEANGRQLLHAGAAGDQRGAVLFVGNAGSGKSSSALACLDAGLDFLGDDLVMMEAGTATASPMVHSLYATAKLKSDNVHRFPNLRASISNLGRGEEDKAMLFLQRDHGRQMVASRPLRALVAPHIDANSPTRLFPISQGAALRALAPSTIKILSSDSGALSRMATLVRQLPLFGLSIGPDCADIPRVIAPLLESSVVAAE